VADRPVHRFRAPLLAVALIVLAGVLWGLVWYWVAPTSATEVIDGAVYLKGNQDLFAAQDGWFAILGAVTGGLLSAVWPSLSRHAPVPGVIAGLVGSAVAGLLAWRIGTWLGPDSLRAQVHAGVKAPITPLSLHAPIAVLMAPMFFAGVRIVMETVAHFLEGRRPDPSPLPPPPTNPANPANPANPTNPANPASPGDSAPQGVDVQQG
jgi:hypothetical protein